MKSDLLIAELECILEILDTNIRNASDHMIVFRHALELLRNRKKDDASAFELGLIAMQYDPAGHHRISRIVEDISNRLRDEPLRKPQMRRSRLRGGALKTKIRAAIEEATCLPLEPTRRAPKAR